MKTTVDIDDKKLNRVMKLTGLKTMRETIDFALMKRSGLPESER
jgi:Arc/MetJ family transcription regulator